MNWFTIDYLLSDPNYKFINEEVTAWAVVTTYMGKTDYASGLPALTSEAKRQIIKYVETTVGLVVTTERFLPVSLGVLSPIGQWSTLTEFIWDNRATLTYV